MSICMSMRRSVWSSKAVVRISWSHPTTTTTLSTSWTKLPLVIWSFVWKILSYIYKERENDVLNYGCRLWGRPGLRGTLDSDSHYERGSHRTTQGNVSSFHSWRHQLPQGLVWMISWPIGYKVENVLLNFNDHGTWQFRMWYTSILLNWKTRLPLTHCIIQVPSDLLFSYSFFVPVFPCSLNLTSQLRHQHHAFWITNRMLLKLFQNLQAVLLYQENPIRIQFDRNDGTDIMEVRWSTQFRSHNELSTIQFWTHCNLSHTYQSLVNKTTQPSLICTVLVAAPTCRLRYKANILNRDTSLKLTSSDLNSMLEGLDDEVEMIRARQDMVDATLSEADLCAGAVATQKQTQCGPEVVKDCMDPYEADSMELDSVNLKHHMTVVQWRRDAASAIISTPLNHCCPSSKHVCWSFPRVLRQ